MEQLLRPLEILETLGKQPAISYFEEKVAHAIEGLLTDAAIPHESDEYGNIIARLTRQPSSGTQSTRPIALVAHMDHPGFEIVDVDGTRLKLQMRGRVSDVVYEQQIDLVVHCANGSVCRARTTGADGDREARILYADMQQPEALTLPAFAVFDLPDCDFGNNRVFARALDDLAGCAATFAVLGDALRRKRTNRYFRHFHTSGRGWTNRSALTGRQWRSSKGNARGFRRILQNFAGR